MFQQYEPSPLVRIAKTIGLVLAAVFGIGYYLWANRTPATNQSTLFATVTPSGTAGAQNFVLLATDAPGQAPLFQYSRLSEGGPAPDFTLKTLAGETASLSQFRGQPVLINFWASWCPPCRLEMPDLVRAYEAHKAEGFVILGVNLTFQDSLPDVRAFVKEFGMTFPVLLDETGEVTENLYRLRGLPFSVFVNRDGMNTRMHLGALKAGQIDEYVGEILQ